MSEKESNDKSNENESALLRIVKDMKQVFFELIQVLLKESTFGTFTRIILIIIEGMQVMHYFFKFPLQSLWKERDFVESVHDVTGYTLIVPFIVKQGDWQMYQSFMYFSIGIYSFIGFLILLIIFTLKKKAAMVQWPVTFIRIIIDLQSSILFLPFFDFFINFFNCSNNEALQKSMHNLFPETECYTGNYATFTILASLFALLMLIIIAFNTLINYECRFNSTNCFAKTSARGDLQFLLFKALLSLLFVFMYNVDYQIVIIIIIFFTTLQLFNYYSFNVFYNNPTISKLITTLHSLNFWGALCLILTVITEDYDFDASSFIYLLGIPFIVLIVAARVEKKFDYLLLNTNDYESLPMALNQLLYITKMIGMYKTDRQVKILLDGFVDFHRSICNKEECNGKKRVMKTNKFSKEMRINRESETYITLISIMQSMYYYGLQKFPSSTRLRILYSLFLLDKMQSKQQALQELLNAEQESPSFDEQFIIFRYKQIIEDELTNQSSLVNQKTGKNDQNDMVNELSIQYHLNQCRTNIERSANLHVEFWGQLSEESPDLGKLSEIGFKITIVNQLANEQWVKLQQINNNMPQMQRLYSKYLIMILNDKRGGLQLLDRLNKEGDQSQKIVDMQTESRPALVISAEEDTFAQITNANLTTVAMIGYNKMEMLNRNIKVAMPQMYAQYHDYFLQNYLTTLEATLLGYLRFLPVRTKMEYVTQVQFMVRAMPSLIHGLQFFGIGSKSKSLQQTSFFVINTEGKVTNISSSCISMFNVSLKKINKGAINVTDIIPDFNTEDEKQMAQMQTKIGVKLPCKSVSKKKTFMYCIVKTETIVFRQVGHQGYQVNVEKIKNITTMQVEDLDNSDKFEKSDNLQQQYVPIQTNMHLDMKFDWKEEQFRGVINPGPPILLAEENNNTVMNILYVDKTQNSDNRDISGEDILNQTNNLETQQIEDNVEGIAKGNTEEKNYGQGIRALRLVGERFIDVEDIKRDEENVIEELEDNENIQQYGQGDNDDDGNDNFEQNQIFKRRDNFLKFIYESQFLKVKCLKNLRLYAIFVILSLSISCVVNHIFVDQELSESHDRYQIIQQANVQIANVQTILSKLLELYGINQNVYGFTDSEKTTFINDRKESISEILINIEEIQNILQLSELDLLPEHSDLLNENEVELRLIKDNTYSLESFDLNEATQIVISKINAIVSRDIENFDPSENDFNFLQYNLLNNFYSGQRKNSNLFVEELQNWVDDKENVFNLILTLGAIWVVLLSILIVPFYCYVQSAQTDVLIVFLDIQIPKIKQLLNKCENFVAQMQSGNEEDMGSEQSVVEVIEEDESQLRQRNSKRKKFKIDLKNKQTFFIPILFASVIYIMYYSLVYVFNKSISDRFAVFVQEINTTNQAESYFGFSNNALKQMVFNDTFVVLQQDSPKLVNNSINNMYELLADVQKFHSYNLEDHDDTYIDVYNQVFMNNTCCDILSERQNVSISQCQEFMDESIQQGFSLSLARHLENIRQIITEYEHIVLDNQSLPKEQIYLKTQQLMGTPVMKEIEDMQYYYIRNLFRYLIENFETSIAQIKDNTNATRITILIIAIILLILIYIVIWIPVLSSINREVVRIRTMITMIPLDVCQSTKSIRNLLYQYTDKNYSLEEQPIQT